MVRVLSVGEPRETVRARYTLVNPMNFNRVLARIVQVDMVSVDVETDGLRPWHGDRLCGVGVGVSPTEGYYFPYRHPKDNLSLTNIQYLWNALRSRPHIVGYNLKFDLAHMHQDGFDSPWKQRLTDLIVGGRLCSPEHFPNLTLAGQLEVHFGPSARLYDDEFKAYLKANKWTKTYHLAPADVVGRYCVEDVLGTYNLLARYEEIIEATNQTQVWEQERYLTHTLWCMEEVGMGYDEEYSQVKIPQLKARIANLYTELYALAGREFNINSGPQVSALMESLGLESPKKSSKTGNSSWAVDVLMGIDHPLPGKMIEIRGLEKVLGTYFEAIATWPNGTVHCNHKNWGTITGRMSCTNPNLQNVSKATQNLLGNDISDEAMAALEAFMGARTGVGQTTKAVTRGGVMGLSSKFTEGDEEVSVRRLFVARPDYHLYMMDYSQMEMRVFADYVGDPNLHALLENPKFDFHSFVARTVWAAEEDSHLWPFYRTLAKAINFGLIYGIGVVKLAAQISKTREEAAQYRIDYFARFPQASAFIEQVGSVVEARGWIFNRFNRRYWIDPDKAYVGVNYLVQGTSADIVKNRMNACMDFLQENGCKSRMMTQVHDEILYEIHDDEEAWLPYELKKIMEVRQIDTLLPVDLSKGLPSWANKAKWDAVTQSWKGDS